jgi:DNA-binding NarL/FixJ family response regulator
MTSPIRILVADDNSLVRRGIRITLDLIDDLEVVGEAEDGEEAIALVESLNPDVVIMDISMPRLDGLKATEYIQAMKTTTKVLVLSIHADPTFVHEALRNGARGYVLKRTLSEELLPALYRVNEGELFLSQTLRESSGHGTE